MPQRHIFEVELPTGEVLEIDAPESTPPDQIKDRARRYMVEQLQANPPKPPSFQPNMQESTMGKIGGAINTVGSYMPSGTTAAQTVGGGLGMLAGSAFGPPGTILGGGIGAGAGDMAAQLAQRVTGSRPSLDVGQQMGAIGGGIVGGAVPELAKFHGEHPLLQAIRSKAESMAQGPLFRSPQSALTRGLSPSDPKFQDYADDALSELKAAEAGGARVHDVESAAAAANRRASENLNIREQIIGPQRSIKVPGSADALKRSQIKAIPDDVRLNDPRKYANLIRKIERANSTDLTIGQISDIASELNATQSSFYGKDLSGQLTMDAGTRAVDIARGRMSRELLTKSLDDFGLGGADSVKQINRRLAALIHLDDALFPLRNQSAIEQGAGLASKVERTAQHVTHNLNPFARSMSPPIDADIATAVARWNKMPTPVSAKLRPMPADLGTRVRALLPPHPSELAETNPVHPMDASQVSGQIAYPEPGTAQQRLGRLLEPGTPPAPAMDVPSGGAEMTVQTGLPYREQVPTAGNLRESVRRTDVSTQQLGRGVDKKLAKVKKLRSK